MGLNFPSEWRKTRLYDVGSLNTNHAFKLLSLYRCRREDNSEAANDDFRRISIFPTAEELKLQQPVLRPNLLKGGWFEHTLVLSSAISAYRRSLTAALTMAISRVAAIAGVISHVAVLTIAISRMAAIAGAISRVANTTTALFVPAN